MSQVNLLPQEILERQKTRRTTALVAFAGVLVLLGIVAFYLVQNGKLGSVNDQIAAQDAKNQQIQTKISRAAALRQPADARRSSSSSC